MKKPPHKSTDTQVGVDISRRQFVKKSTYVAPALVTLGFGLGSKNANAQLNPPSDPNPPGTQSNIPDPRYNKSRKDGRS